MSDATVYSELLISLLQKRGVHSTEDIGAFLNPDYSRDTHSPSLLLGIEIAVARLFVAMEEKERIAIYADFDCDGIPGAALLSEVFKKIGYEKFEVYLPHRDREGYGFHEDAIRTLKERAVSLIITVDVGTTAVESVRFAKSLGIDVIVTDHHEIVGKVPDAVAVLNPKLGEYPFRDLCGSGVAFKFAQAILAEGRVRGLPEFIAIPEGWEKWLLDLVAIATIGDMVPLVGENRVLTYYGLQVLRKSPRPGIRALCSKLRLRQNEITEDDVSFSIVPRINAASRMGDPETALHLLTTHDASEAEQLAAHLEELNAKRKGVVAAMVKDAKKRMHARGTESKKILVLGDPDWKPSLCGLVANSLMNERGGIACVWGKDAMGKIKGSCRSDGVVSLSDLFEVASEEFEECGGHKASGGFTVSFEKVHTLQQKLEEAIKKIGEGTVVDSETELHDARTTLSGVSWTLFRDVAQLAPFGMGNTKPIFRIPKARVSFVKQFGKEKNHVELTLMCSTTGAQTRAFQFFKASDDFSHTPYAGDEVDVLVTLERDSFRGPATLALRIIDVLHSSS